MDYSKSDWKLFRDQIGDWQESYIEKLNHQYIDLLAVSCITNMATGIQTVKHSHARVLEIANQAGETLCRWLGAVIQKMEG